MYRPSDNLAYRYPVSIKGIINIDGKVPLLKNERSEYELPGGKIEPDETPESCVRREIGEELNLCVTVSSLVSAWVYPITQETVVFIVAYYCELEQPKQTIKISDEHVDCRLFSPNDVGVLNMPSGYKYAIQQCKTLMG